MLLLLLGIAMLPVRLAVHVAGDLVAGFTISLRYRALGLLRGARVLRAPGVAGAAAHATPPATAGTDAAALAGPTEPLEASPAAADSARTRGGDGRLRRLADRVRCAHRLLGSRALRVARPRGWLAFALGDPGETGRAYGFALTVATLADPEGAIELRPLWTDRDWLAADVALDARVIPLRVALVAARAWLERRRATAAPAPAECSARAA